MRVCKIKAARIFHRGVPPMALFLSLTMSALLIAAQTLNTRSFDTPAIPQSDSRDNQKAAQVGGWVRVAPAGEEFTVLLPHQPEMKTKPGTDGAVRLYGVHNDGGIYLITSSPKPNGGGAGEALNPLAGEYE